MSDLSTADAAPEWDAADEKTFYEMIAEIEQVREQTRQIDHRMAQDRAESRVITERTDRNLDLLRRAREEYNNSHCYAPLHTESEAADIERENTFLRAEIERLRKERNLMPFFEDFLRPRHGSNRSAANAGKG